jgi:hypothetical protein
MTIAIRIQPTLDDLYPVKIAKVPGLIIGKLIIRRE